MTLSLFYHPFSSFCQKVLIALYEREVPFEPVIVDLGDEGQRAALAALWPPARFPVLRDDASELALPESSIIIEHLDRAHAGPPPMVPTDPEAALRVRLWDRIFDNEVSVPLQKVVGDSLRPDGAHDPHGVEVAKAALGTAYALIDRELERRGCEWIAGDSFTLADCSAAPALFYANIVLPFAGHAQLEAYYRRLLARPSFARAVDEARPYRHLFPLEWPASYA
jgi:glutathione S-transferase